MRRDAIDAAAFHAEYAGRERPELDVELLAAGATVAELEARREELQGAPAAPMAAAHAIPNPPTPAGGDEWLTTKDAAAELRVTVKGLERMRAQGHGPPFTRIGRSVRYRRSDLGGR